MTRGPKKTKATKSETEASQQRVEQSGSSGLNKLLNKQDYYKIVIE